MVQTAFLDLTPDDLAAINADDFAMLPLEVSPAPVGTNPYPLTIDGARYLIIAQAYAAAYEGQMAIASKFADAAFALKCLDQEVVTAQLLPIFFTSYRLAQTFYSRTDGYLSAVTTLQRHVEVRSRLDVESWIMDEVPGGLVPAAWAVLSKKAGYDIDEVIDPSTESSSSI